MLRHVRCGASIWTLVQRPDRVKGGPGETVPGLREVITKERAAENEALVPSQLRAQELDFAVKQFPGTGASSQQMPQTAPAFM